MNGRDWTVKIPGFGQFEVELTGICDCSCLANPVRCTVKFISVCSTYNYRQITVIFAMMVMVILFADSVIVIQDGMHI